MLFFAFILYMIPPAAETLTALCTIVTEIFCPSFCQSHRVAIFTVTAYNHSRTISVHTVAALPAAIFV
jgi:hypothetical protein